MIEKKSQNKKQESKPALKGKKSGFDMREHLTLKNDAVQAEIYENKHNKSLNKTSQKNTKHLPVGIQKMRQKIRDVYDEEDEDIYEYTFVKAPKIEEETKNSSEQEKSQAEETAQKQKETNSIIKSQQDVGKMEALEVASRLAKEVGLKGVKKQTVNKEMQDVRFRPQQTYTRAVENDITKELGLKGKVKDKKIIQAVRGIKTVEELGSKKAVKNLDMSDMVKVGEKKMDQKELAELILKKSGQDITKYQQKHPIKQETKLKSIENKPTNKLDENKEKLHKQDQKSNDIETLKKVFSSKSNESGR